jgi:DNA mismatch endonuclease (patch repair protein)
MLRGSVCRVVKEKKKPWFKKPPTATSRRMRLVRSVNTNLEKTMESLLRTQGIKYQRQPLLFGRPDFRIKSTKVLIFCDSSFWHGRRVKELTGEAFKKNKEFWVNKLQENKKRDSKINSALRKEGWKVLRFWDTDILSRPSKIVKKLALEIKNG